VRRSAPRVASAGGREGGSSRSRAALGAAVLFALVRFSGDVAFADVSAYLLIAYFAGTLASGSYAASVAWREGRFAPIAGVGGIPVEPRTVAPGPPEAAPPASTEAVT